MALDEEKAEGVGAKASIPPVLDEEKEGVALQQSASNAASEDRRSDQTDSQHDQKSQDSDRTGLEQDGKQEAEPKSLLDKAVSKSSQTLHAVPRSQRRGLLARLAIVPEVTNPYDYKDSTKWMMTISVALAATASSAGASISYPALADMAIDLDTTVTVTNLSLAFYMLAMAFSPVWWSSFSETSGRRSIHILSFFLFLIFSCLSAVSVNIAMLIVFRILSGGAAASVQAVGAGTVADIWEPKRRGRAMGVFYLGPLCGPGLAPVVGGALTQGLGWRSTMWFLAIFGGAMLLLICIFLPETLPKRDPTNAGPEPRERKGVLILKRFVDPFKMMALLQYPPIIVSVFSAAMAFGALFVINISLESNFLKPPYNFSTTTTGLTYLAPTLGSVLSSLLGGPWIDHIMAREARKAGRYDADGKPVYLPEDRMKENIWLAATLYPAALIWYGWTIDKGVLWIVPCIASFFFGLGAMLVFGAVTTMLTEFTPRNASSGVAVNNFVRNIFSCVGTIVTQPVMDAIGTGWTCTIVGLFALVMGNAAILALKTWGPRWRVSMDRKLNAQK